MRKLLLLIGLCSTLSAATPYIDVDGRFLDFRKGGGASLYWPLSQDGKQVLFSQTHMGQYRKRLTAASTGLGYRRLWRPNIGWGLNLFYDYTNSPAKSYYQGGVGAEIFGACWDFRLNGYISDFRQTTLQRAGIVVGTSIVRNDLLERAYSGLDFEGGYSFSLWNAELWGYAGYYHFAARSGKPIQGPRIRGEVRWPDICGVEFRLGGEWSNDRLHGNQGGLIAHLRIPFGGCRRCSSPRICRRLHDLVHRENSIWIERERPLGNNTGFDVIFVANQPLTLMANKGLMAPPFVRTGSQSDPTSLEDALDRSGENGIIFLLTNPTTGAISNFTGDVVLKNGQQLVGFGDGNTQTVQLPDGTPVLIVKEDPTGTRGTLALQGAASNIALANDNKIFGIGFDGTGGITGAVIQGTNSSDVFCSDLLIEGTTFRGIALTSCTGICIENSTINTTRSNISLSSCGGDVIIRNNRLARLNNTFEGLVDFDTLLAGRALIEGNTFAPTGAFITELTGVIFRNLSPGVGFCDITIRNNAFVQSASQAILIDSAVLAPELVTPGITNVNIHQNALTTSNDIPLLSYSLALIGNITCTDNIHTRTGGGNPSRSFNISDANATLCVTLEGNQALPAPTATSIRFSAAPTIGVYPAQATLPAANNGMGVTVSSGTLVDQPTPCPLPSVP